MKVTADTITDEQIREWESDVLATGTDSEKCKAVDLATLALGDVPTIEQVLESMPDDATYGEARDPRPVIAKAARRRKRARAR